MLYVLYKRIISRYYIKKKHYINSKKRQKRCVREEKLSAIHRFTMHLDFGGTVPIFRALSYLF